MFSIPLLIFSLFLGVLSCLTVHLRGYDGVALCLFPIAHGRGFRSTRVFVTVKVADLQFESRQMSLC